MIYDLILNVIKSFPNNTNFYSLGAKEVMAAKLTKAIKENEMKLSNQHGSHHDGATKVSIRAK